MSRLREGYQLVSHQIPQLTVRPGRVWSSRAQDDARPDASATAAAGGAYVWWFQKHAAACPQSHPTLTDRTGSRRARLQASSSVVRTVQPDRLAPLSGPSPLQVCLICTAGCVQPPPPAAASVRPAPPPAAARRHSLTAACSAPLVGPLSLHCSAAQMSSITLQPAHGAVVGTVVASALVHVSFAGPGGGCVVSVRLHAGSPLELALLLSSIHCSTFGWASRWAAPARSTEWCTRRCEGRCAHCLLAQM